MWAPPAQWTFACRVGWGVYFHGNRKGVHRIPKYLLYYIYSTSRFKSNLAGWKMDPDWVDVFPTKNGGIPASYLSLPEGTRFYLECHLSWILVGGFICLVHHLQVDSTNKKQFFFFDTIHVWIFGCLKQGVIPFFVGDFILLGVHKSVCVFLALWFFHDIKVDSE